MNTNLQKIEKLLQEFKSFGKLSEANNHRLWKKFRLEFNYNSNHIEGNTLTYGETELLLFFDKTTGNHSFREYDEMKAHDVALKLIMDWANDKERELNEAFIRELNKIILVKPFWKEAITPNNQPTKREIKIGEYKSLPNSVRLQNGEMFHYPTPEETPALMKDLMLWYQEAILQSMHPVQLAALFHYKFVRIHPFDDGNGRVARLLMNYILIRNNYPPVIIKSVDKANYLMALNLADVGNLDAFQNYIAEQLIWSLELSIKAAKGEDIEEPDDVDKEIEVLKRSFNKEDEIQVVKSIQAVYDTFYNSFIPLIVSLSSEVNKFEELFFEKKEHVFYRNKELRLDQLKEEISNLYTNHLFSNQITLNEILSENTNEISVPNVENITINFDLNGFKKNGLKTFDLYLRVQFYFNRYGYSITFNYKDLNKEKQYSEILSKEEINQITKAISKYFVNEIKQKTGKE